MRRVQNHFGIASSSVASADLNERRHEHVQAWMLETETVIDEEMISETEEADPRRNISDAPVRQQDGYRSLLQVAGQSQLESRILVSKDLEPLSPQEEYRSQLRVARQFGISSTFRLARSYLSRSKVMAESLT
jgi:hypothetical protein